ncbi:MAG: hypothetical protein KAJ81_10060 [Candidatus Latescibacteria bacterium]|nr:hypothetical protein [Candidatus Latescibacterota bacterium]
MTPKRVTMSGIFRKRDWPSLFPLSILTIVLCAMLHSVCVADGYDLSKSLHYTGEGMRYWYEEPGGFMDVTHIPYSELDCSGCHVTSCDQCHTEASGGKATDMGTCLACHSRANLTFKMGREDGTLDVHVARGMGCTDCHKIKDVHGDGAFYHSMRDEGAIRASCIACHEPDQNIAGHVVHRDDLDCSACHVANTTACMNCHFDTFLETGSRKGNFVLTKDWLLLINYKGKVTAGGAQSLIYKDQKFIAYAPYFTHAIQAEGRGCRDCHDNEAAKKIMKGESVPMMAFENDRVVSWEGVVPVVPEHLEWAFLNKKDDGWTPVDNEDPPKIQFVGYGEPLTQGQVRKLAMQVEEHRPTSVEQEAEAASPRRWALHPGHPDPFNAHTQFSYDVAKEGHVLLSVCDSLGRRIRILSSGTLAEGSYTATWDGLDDRGEPAISGAYLIRMEAGDFLETRKIVLIR